jgi:hypothetical protein
MTSGREQALLELDAVTRVVVEATSVRALRARLILPWIDQADRMGASWSERRPHLLAMFPATDMKLEAEIQKISAVFSNARKPLKRNPMGLEAEYERVAEAAGVRLPEFLSVRPNAETKRVTDLASFKPAVDDVIVSISNGTRAAAGLTRVLVESGLARGEAALIDQLIATIGVMSELVTELSIRGRGR